MNGPADWSFKNLRLALAPMGRSLTVGLKILTGWRPGGQDIYQMRVGDSVNLAAGCRLDC